MIARAATPSLLRPGTCGSAVLSGLLLMAGCGGHARPPALAPAPAPLKGAFVDDYGTRHTIDDSIWQHGADTRYHVIAWHPASHFLIARNDSANATDGGRYARIDWLGLPGGDAWEWAFCIATWDAPSRAVAQASAVADTAKPRSGCGGYPFTRMRRALPTP